ncbi:MAG: phosphatase PAP2 family protein [Mesorhizobium sp.]|nr:phosphatase PAP2 family protein [Mesorhizobium sp.]MBL8576846.1 phosphatase PAP2 family protein [Mesorhizobium sp.]
MTLRYWEKIEFSVLAAGVFIAGCLWGFFEMAEVARQTPVRGLDAEILLAFREAGRPDVALGPPWLVEAVRDITALGSVSVLVLVTAAAIFYLLLIRRGREALMILVAVGGGQIVSSLLKIGIDRPRPDLVSHLVQVQTLSFPSGHAMMSAVTYLTLGVMIAGIAPGKVTKAYVLFMAVLITLMVGVSRLYLGVHWPSDVLAGWFAGFAWVMLYWLVLRRFARRPEAPSL